LLKIILLSLFSLSLGSELSCSSSFIPGTISWTENGKAMTSYIIQSGGSNGLVTTSGNSVTTKMNPRFYMATSCASGFSPNIFQSLNLLGATITFTVNLANVGCGENAAFYLVGMPASSSQSTGDYYCDANCVGGCCTEMDLMEANRHALQITPHKCTSATSGCDGDGCARNTQSVSGGYGPGSNYKINTNNAFTVAITFHTTSGQLSSITSVISQGSNSITLTHDSSCGSGYLQAMTTYFGTGLVPVWSFWNGGMMWLDSPACSSDTSEISSPQFIFSNLIVSGAGATVPPPPPPPVPPATQYCGNNGCTTNANWVEFTSTYSSSSPAAYVSCGSGSVTFPCTYSSGGGKWQCSCPGSTGCSNPVPYVNGKICPIVNGNAVAAQGEETAQSSVTLNTTAITLIAVGSIVGVILIVVIVVLVVRKKKTEEYV